MNFKDCYKILLDYPKDCILILHKLLDIGGSCLYPYDSYIFLITQKYAKKLNSNDKKEVYHYQNSI